MCFFDNSKSYTLDNEVSIKWNTVQIFSFIKNKKTTAYGSGFPTRS
ncbi:hypothetical protein BACI71_160038 [Bacillus mycoides]|uniref:Uncharacterized protein n=1 Tax=Bacillus mycoides TaxID=1405 RepID=A0A653UN22_BACMY|nr:hypothetical protein BACI71_160038 [Bacillus mycoides]